MRVPGEQLEAAFAELQQKNGEKSRAASEDTVKSGPKHFLQKNKAKSGVKRLKVVAV